jgi:hypothetical protein
MELTLVYELSFQMIKQKNINLRKINNREFSVLI